MADHNWGQPPGGGGGWGQPPGGGPQPAPGGPQPAPGGPEAAPGWPPQAAPGAAQGAPGGPTTAAWQPPSGPAFGGGAASRGSNPLSIASLILGGTSLASGLCCCVPLAGVVAMIAMPTLGLAAVVTGILGFQAAGRMGGVGKSESIVGIVFGALGLAAGGLAVVVALVYGGLMFAGSQPGY